MSKITDKIYLGNIKDAKKKKYDVILNLSEEPLSREDIICINMPMVDDPKFNIKKYLPITNNIIYTCLQNNKKLLINCHMGISRSSTILIYFLMTHCNMTRQDAYDYVKSKRHIIDPNPGFWKILK